MGTTPTRGSRGSPMTVRSAEHHIDQSRVGCPSHPSWVSSPSKCQPSVPGRCAPSERRRQSASGYATLTALWVVVHRLSCGLFPRQNSCHVLRRRCQETEAQRGEVVREQYGCGDDRGAEKGRECGRGDSHEIGRGTAERFESSLCSVLSGLRRAGRQLRAEMSGSAGANL